MSNYEASASSHAIDRSRFGSTGSLSSSPNSGEAPAAGALTNGSRRGSCHGDVYSPEVEAMDSPVEGGFRQLPPANVPQSVAVMRSHIKELYGRLSVAEGEKQKIADEAYRRALDIKNDYELQLEDARASQGKQAGLVERLKVGEHAILKASFTLICELIPRRTSSSSTEGRSTRPTGG